jgi:hypothetical protein
VAANTLEVIAMIGLGKASLSLPVIAIVLLCTTLTFAVPPRTRTIKKLSRQDEPVRVISVRVKSKAVQFGKSFKGTDDWLGGLNVVIQNTSAKSVSWARVALAFRQPKALGSTLNDFMTYGIGRWDIDKIRGGGPPLKPGETAEVSYSTEQYQSVREILDGMGYPRNIAEIQLSVDQVIFEDQPELMWIEGTMNEFHSPTGWRPVKP